MIYKLKSLTLFVIPLRFLLKYVIILAILNRFKSSLIIGEYDNKDKITPLLTASEIEHIEKQEKKQKQLEEERYKARRAERAKKQPS